MAECRALVMGGTSGIGRAVAVALATSGCEVTVTGLTSAEVESFAASNAGASGKLTARQLDVCDEAGVAALVGELDGLDVLVNCAGTILRDRQEHDPAQFAHVVDVNLNGTMRVSAACRPLLAASRGCVVNTASMLSIFGSGHVPAYSASKGGVVQLTKSLAIDWAQDGIRVNAVAPGWIETALTRPLVENPQRNREIIDRTPLGRWGTPEDVAGAYVFLCSHAARFITGVVLPVDGGYSIA
jgi:NAD(P)-dependent dehydrogenase (short-subunit alcohol dehydrogenase family)